MNNNFRFFLTSITISTAMVSSTAFGCLDDEQERSEIRSFIFSPDGKNHAFSTSQSIEIRDVNGELTVVIDGKIIPADRIKKEDGRIKIFDEKGNELPLFGISIDGGKAGKGMFLNLRNLMGEGDDAHTMMQWFGGDVEPPKVMIGVQLSQTSKALEYHLGLDAGTSTMLTEVFDGLAAAEAGIQKYDIVVAINGQTPADPESIRLALVDKEPGDEITLHIIHQGKNRKVNIHLKKYDSTRFGAFRLLEINENLPFGPNGIFEFKFDGNLENLHELLVDPHKGNIFRRRLGDREFHFEFNDELMERLGEDFGGDIKLKLRMHLNNKNEHQESRTEMIHEQIDKLQIMLDKLIEQVKTLEESDSDI